MAAVFDPSKPFETVVDKEFAAFTAPKTSTPAPKPSAPRFDPNQPYEVVPEAKPVSPVESGTLQFNPDADFEKVFSLDDIKSKPEEELDKDSKFHPVEFGLQHQSELQNDPEALEKVVRLYKARETRGTTLLEKGESILTGIPKVAKEIGKGLLATAKRGAELSPVGLVARAAGAATVPGGLEAESKRVAGEIVEIPASVESAGAGSGELLRRGGREIREGVTGGKASMSPQEWRNRFFMDLAGLEQSQKVGQGNGEVMKALGNDAETLTQYGIELNPETIQELSIVTDPINYIPIAGGVGAVTKIGGKLVSRVVATTLNPRQAAILASALNRAGEVATLGREVAGKGVQAVGAGVEKTGQLAQKGVDTLAGPATLGTILGGDITKGLGVGIALRTTPKVLEKTGQAIKATGEILEGTRPVPGAIRAAGEVAGQGAVGLGEGLLLSLPFELGARPEEEEAVLGAAGLAGGVRTGLRTAKIAGTKAQDVLAQQIFKQVEQAEAPPSATYGSDPALDTAHQVASANLAPNSQKLLNWTRELFRDSGVEIYSLDNKTFEGQTGTGNAHGYAVNVGQKVSPDGTVTPVLRILLNADTEALPHELFHALEDLDPQGAKGLIDSVLKSWTPEQKESFSDIYNTARNDGRPKSAWTTRLTDEAVGQEAAAEVFSRLYLGQDLSGVAPGITQKAAIFLSGILEKLGVPLGKVGAQPGEPGVSTLGVRPAVEPTRVGNEWIQRFLNKIRERGNILPEEPVASPLAGGELVPGDISRRPAAQVPPKPTAPVPQPVPKPAPVAPPATPAPTPARNIRVTREQQNDFAARRAADLGIDRAKAAATDEATQRVNEVSALMEAGNPVLEIDHRGAIAAGTEKAPSGRTARRAEQEAAYIAEGLGAAPESVRDRHQKTFVPVRWEIVNGKPQLIAMSLDKVIANVSRAVKDIVAAKQEAKLPYEVDAATGKLTEAAWESVVNDLQSYTENQSNGYRGDGQKLVRPGEDLQQSLPAENPNYNPVVLPEDKTNFLNLIQGLSPALTSREVKGRVPGAVKGAAIARAQGREPQVPSMIRPQDITKQVYKSGERILETNPLRNELAAAGVPVRELIEVTERINAGDILSIKERPDLQFKAPVTDIIRGGFLPKESVKRLEPSEPLRDLAKSYAEFSGVPYKPEGKYVEVNPDLAKRIADFYESTPSNPADPKVEASYRALMNETLNQYTALLDAGYKIEPWTGEGEPYKSSADAIADVRDNKHIYVLPTENNFGSPGAAAAQNLLLTQSGVPGLPTMNDVFRGVHDIFGHAKEGFQFGPRGELNAWRAHSEMYSPEAQGALAAETLAQNSWVNFGKHLRNETGNVAQKGEPGYVQLPNRPFAEQKNLVVPDELITEAKGKPEGGQFLPKDQPVEEIAKEIRDLDTAGLKNKFREWGTSLTQAAYDVGRNVKSQADVSTLRALREEASAIARAAIKTGDFDAATPAAAKAQFWQEAIEAATGEGGKLDLIRGALKQPDFQPPFPTEKGQLLPKETRPTEEGNSFRGSLLPKPTPDIISKFSDASPEVKDPSGEPRPFFHGSFKSEELIQSGRWDINKTNKRGLFGPGFYFTGSTDAAGGPFWKNKIRTFFGLEPLGYAVKPTGQNSFLDNLLSEERNANPSPGIVPAYLNLKNPFNIEKTYAPEEIQEILTVVDPLKKDRIPELADPLKELTEEPRTGEQIFHVLREYARDSDSGAETSLRTDDNAYQEVIVKSWLEKAGFDGITYLGGVRRKGVGLHSVVVAWKPEQIFNALDTSAPPGTFLSPLKQETAGVEFLPKPVPPVPNYFEVPGRQISALDADMIQARGTPSKFWLNAKTGKILPATEGHVDVAKEILPNPPKEQAEVYDAMERAGWVRGVNEGVGGIQLNGPELRRPAKITVEDIAFASRRPVKLNGESVVDPKLEFLPKGKLPDYLAEDQTAISPGVREQIKERGTTPEFWINSKTGKIILAPDGHEEAASATVLKDFQHEGSEDILAEVYDEMDRLGWLRGVIHGGPIELNGGSRLGRAAEKTLQDLSFKNKIGVELNGRDYIESPTVPEFPGDFLPKKKDETDYSKYNVEATPSTVTSGWILPDQTFVPLQQSFHEQYLAENSPDLNKKFKTKFSGTPDIEERLDALNAGFTRIRYQDGKMHVEVNQKFWGKQKPEILDRLLSDPESIDSVTISLLNNKGQVVDSQSSPRLFESEDRPGDIQKLVDDLRPRGSFLPQEAELTFKGFEPLSPEQRAKAITKRKVSRTRESNPEAVLPKYAREEDGSLSLTAEGKPRPVALEYDLANTPLAKEAAKGKRGAERESAIADALGEELVGAYKQAKKNKDLMAGSTWYSTARVRLKKLFGDDSKFFAELLGATSARTPVETNFKFALDAYNRFKSGEYDDILAKYREGKSLWDAGDIQEYVKETKNEDPTRGQFLDWWVEKHDLSPVQSNEKKFGANSRAVLRVLDGSWQSEVKGPKTPNFAGNLTGQTFEATIDVWAARALHRLANRDNEGRWRILPENETGVTDADFYLGQAAFRKAAEKLGIKPDALQAVLWFAEKKHWEDRGWTRGAGAERSDFNTLLAETEKTPEGLFQKKKTQKELELE